MEREIWPKMNQADIYLYMAILGSALFLIKVVLMLMFGGGDTDMDLDADVDVDVDMDIDADHPDSSGSFTLLSIQSFLAFFMGMGWTGWGCVTELKLGTATSVAVSGAVGFAFMLLFAFLFAQLKKLDDRKQLNVRSSVGSHGRAYMRIPAKGKGQGKVELTVQGRRMILRARSTDAEITSFTDVTVVAVEDDNSLIVEPRA